ncbi:hypothetical protein [Tropicimonas sp. S265A]|uniref:hypothetical protein n=1 Tax=Tropicimonas sp. S265A TaxID=3415134 RepID=UPI003C7CF0E0
MTHDPESDLDPLLDMFSAARQDRARPSPDFMERVARDGLNVQATLVSAPKPIRARPRWRISLPDWRPLGGLAVCLMLGIGLGSGFSTQLSLLGTEYLSGGIVSGGDLFLANYDDVLLLEGG